MKKNIAILKGDGIGPEIVGSALEVLFAVGKKFGHEFVCTDYLIGGAAIDATGMGLPKATIDGCLASDSVLLGSVGGPKWETLAGDKRPEKALLGIREAMQVYSNIRPAKVYTALAEASPLDKKIIANGFDLVIVRELTGGIYFGERGRGADFAWDTEKYSVEEVERIGKVAFDLARLRGKKVTSIDKANVLESSRLWREVMHKLAQENPDIAYEDMLVDNCAMQLIKNPSQFDVVVTSNMFGDILSDEASQLTGSIGMLPSSSLGSTTRGLYEPIHGSAPDIAGQDKANPIATILSVAMMLRSSFGMLKEAQAIETAVDKALAKGLRTGDIASAGTTLIGCKQMGQEVAGLI